MRLAKSTKPLPLPRVRYEPPTIEEALTAARDLSPDLDMQVEIAAGLMGVPEDQVRPHVVRPTLRRPTTSLNVGRRVVVVERKGSRIPLRSARP